MPERLGGIRIAADLCQRIDTRKCADEKRLSDAALECDLPELERDVIACGGNDGALSRILWNREAG